MRATSHLLSAMVSLAGCARPSSDVPMPDYWSLPSLEEVAREKEGTVLLGMKRTGCFGSCPVYRVVVRTDGQVEYFGGFHVATPGAHSTRLSPQHLAELRGIVAEANVGDLDRSRWRCPQGHPDEAGVELIAPLSGLSESICYPTGSDSPPQQLKTLTLGGLDVKVDLTVDTEQWVGRRPAYRE